MTRPVSRSAAPVQALLFMLLGVFGFSIVDAATKWLAGDFGTWQIVALTRLPPRDAEVLILKYAEGWSYRELAEHLGQSEPAVESRLHRARQRLRQELTAARVIEVDP